VAMAAAMAAAWAAARAVAKVVDPEVAMEVGLVGVGKVGKGATAVVALGNDTSRAMRGGCLVGVSAAGRVVAVTAVAMEVAETAAAAKEAERGYESRAVCKSWRLGGS